jgi:transcription elongation GreA/GreB family factor
MPKKELLQQIITTLNSDLEILTEAAKTAHAAATDEECIADNKYDTTGLEASYIAQGQANRAQEIRQSLACYRTLELRDFNEQTPVCLTALITLEADDGSCRQVFLGPAAGGLKVSYDSEECIVITPESPLGRALLGKICDDELQVDSGGAQKNLTIVAVV